MVFSYRNDSVFIGVHRFCNFYSDLLQFRGFHISVLTSVGLWLDMGVL